MPSTTLADLVLKQLLEAGVLDLSALAQRLALTGTILDEVIGLLRTDAKVQVLGTAADGPFLRFGLTEQGRAAALAALARDGYVGPAPVPLEAYRRVVAAQTRRDAPLTRTQVHNAFADTVIDPELLDRLGPAVNSGRPLFIYGPAGTGKSYIARRLSRLLGPPVFIPYGIAVGDAIVRCLDPGVHRSVRSHGAESLMFSEGFDPRYALCERPTVITGGELTADMLNLHFDPATRQYRAPIQLRANNGLLLIDDLGRQRILPATLFNRWIIPLEDRVDHLSLKGGEHFSVPFDLVLVLSTNLDPRRLADDAFLRRIGYKVRFAPTTPEQYEAIFLQECERMKIAPDPALPRFLIDELHARYDVPLLPCHPRDMLGLALDYSRYNGVDHIGQSALRWAWNNYFVQTATHADDVPDAYFAGVEAEHTGAER